MTGRKAFVLFLSFILILSLLFPLVSCSGKPAGTETDPPSPSGTEASSEPTHSEPDTAEPSSEGDPGEAVTEEALLSSGFPLLRIEIDESKGTIADMNQDPDHETRCHGEVRIDIPKGYSSEYENKIYAEASSQTYTLDYIRGRGNSTWSAPKKPYKIKLDKKADLFGMGSDKNWALLANYYDCTMLRNKMTYSLGRSFLPKSAFVPESVFVHVMMNGEYLGLYALSEDIRFGKARIDAEEPSREADASESALSGGYLLMTELFGDKGRGFHTDRNSFQIDTPDSEDLTEAQFTYISNYMEELESAIYQGGSFEELLDLDSYIDYYLIEELSGNRDGYRSSSTYLIKEKDDKLVFGPLWDFDYVSWSGGLQEAEGFVNADYAPWFEQFLYMEGFKEKLLSRWSDLKALMLSYCAEGGQIDSWAVSLRPALSLNDRVASTFLWDTKDPFGGSGTETLTEEEARKLRTDYSFDNEVERLKRWILSRVEWLDEHFPEIRPAMCAIDFTDGGRVVKFQKTPRDEALPEDVIPVPEIRKGYRFTGWYREDAEAGNVPLSLTDAQDLDADYLVYHAEWEEYDASQDLLFLGFSSNLYYVPVGVYLDLQDLISVSPFDFEKAYLDLEISMEPSDCAYLSDTALMISKEGDISVTVKLGDKEASCRLTVVREEAFIAPVSYSLPNSISMKAGVFLFLPLEPNEGAMLPARRSYEKPDFTVPDTGIVEIDPNGLIHALSEGSVTLTVYDSQTDQTLLCVLTVK